MRFSFTIAASVLLVLLGFGAYYTHLEFQRNLQPPPSLFPFTKDDFPQIAKVIVWARGDKAVCEKRPPLGWWYFTNSDRGKADSRKIAGIFKRIADLKVSKPLVQNAPDLAQFGLEKERTAVEIWFNDKPYYIVFGREDIKQEKRYARLKDSRDVFLVGNSLFKLVNKGQLELADLRIFGVNSEEIEMVSFKEKDIEFDLIMVGSQFKSTKPQEKVLPVQKARNVFSRFSDLQITRLEQRIIKADETSLDKPELFLNLTTKGYRVEVSLAKKNEKFYYGKRNTDEQIFEIRQGTVKGLISAMKALLKEEKTETTEKKENTGN